MTTRNKLMSPRLVCGCCSRPWDASAPCCGVCGATYPVNLGPAINELTPRAAARVDRDVPGIKIDTLDGARDLTPINYAALLSRAMGGVVSGMTVLIWGLPGAGKSTLAAEL